jgi:hypothetical protein
MKYAEVVTESRITNITLVLLLIFMGLGWCLESSFWYNIVILVVSLALIFHSINYYLTARNKTLGTVLIIASISFCMYNLLRIFFLK